MCIVFKWSKITHGKVIVYDSGVLAGTGNVNFINCQVALDQGVSLIQFSGLFTKPGRCLAHSVYSINLGRINILV